MTTSEQYYQTLEELYLELGAVLDRLTIVNNNYIDFLDKEYGLDAITDQASSDINTVTECIADMADVHQKLDSVLYSEH